MYYLRAWVCVCGCGCGCLCGCVWGTCVQIKIVTNMKLATLDFFLSELSNWCSINTKVLQFCSICHLKQVMQQPQYELHLKHVEYWLKWNLDSRGFLFVFTLMKIKLYFSLLYGSIHSCILFLQKNWKNYFRFLVFSLGMEDYVSFTIFYK